jgi:hypothetical protein
MTPVKLIKSLFKELAAIVFNTHRPSGLLRLKRKAAVQSALNGGFLHHGLLLFYLRTSLFSRSARFRALRCNR